MNSSAQIAYRKLQEACRLKNRARRSGWALLIVALVLAVLLILALVDYWLVLPASLRFAGAGGLVFLLAGGLLGLLKLIRHAASVKEVALDAESLQPNLGCTVSTTAEYLTEERKIVHEYEPELVDALHAQAAAALQALRFPYWKRIKRPAAFVVAVLVLLLGFVGLVPSSLTALKRVAIPFLNAAYTRVEVRPGTTEIPAGKDLEIKAVFHGRKPGNPTLHWRPARSSKWQSARLKPNETGHVTHTLKALEDQVTYRVSGGDAKSPEFCVSTYIPPGIKDLQVQISYPTYTKRKPQLQTSADIVVVRGSVAKLGLVSTMPLSQARLRFEKAAALALDSQPSTLNSFSGTFSITNDTDYWIELRDKAAHLGVNEKPYRVKALPDLPPKLEILEPGQDIRAEPTSVIPVKISAIDDFGVEEIKLVYHKLGGPEQTILARTRSETNGEVTAVVELPLGPLQLNDYELVAYHAEARDNNSLDGPGVGKSPLFFIEITDEQGGNCKSQCNSQKVNLLVIQKQIIADTQALAKNAEASSYKEIADRESEAIYFGKMYLNALTGSGAPPGAVDQMNFALKDMKAATAALNQKNRDSALPPEESTLARFYQILKLLPELEDLPTEPPPMAGGAPKNQSPMIKVVLEAIKKQKQNNPDNKQLAELVQNLDQLRRSQSALSQACQNPSSNPNGSSAAPTPSPSPQAAETPGQKTADKKSEAETGKLAGQQDKLSQEADALAKRLAGLAGKDARLGHNVTRSMDSVPPGMKAAADALRSGDRPTGFAHGKETYYTLNTVISMLEKILEREGRLADISSEEYPKEYDQAIRDYLKRLSYQE